MGAKIIRHGAHYIEFDVDRGTIQAYSESSRVKTYSERDAATILLSAELKSVQDNINYGQAVAELVIDDLEAT